RSPRNEQKAKGSPTPLTGKRHELLALLSLAGRLLRPPPLSRAPQRRTRDPCLAWKERETRRLSFRSAPLRSRQPRAPALPPRAANELCQRVAALPLVRGARGFPPLHCASTT